MSVQALQLGVTGFDFNTKAIRRNNFKITAKVINLFNAPLRATA